MRMIRQTSFKELSLFDRKEKNDFNFEASHEKVSLVELVWLQFNY